MKWLGDYPEDFATVPVLFGTNSAAGGAVAPSSAFEVDDFKIFKNGSDVEKTTTNGLSIASPFNATTGLHRLLIDTSNDTGDAGFWTAGAAYSVVLVPDETIDGQTVAVPLGTFTLGMVHRADVRQAGGLDLERTLQAGGTTTATLAANEFGLDDAYNGFLFQTTSGTGAGQTLKATDYNGTTKVVTWEVWQTQAAPALTDDTTKYVVLGPAPTATGGGSADWTTNEKAAIRTILGFDGSGVVGNATSGMLDTIRDLAAALDNRLPSDPADASDIAALIASVTSALTLIDTAVGNVPAAVLTAAQTTPIHADLRLLLGVLTGVTAFERAARGMAVGTVGTGSTTTSIVTSALTPSAAAVDQFKGKIVTFAGNTTTAALRGQSTDITASSNAGVLTVTALTTAPVSGDTFTIS